MGFVGTYGAYEQEGEGEAIDFKDKTDFGISCSTYSKQVIARKKTWV